MASPAKKPMPKKGTKPAAKGGKKMPPFLMKGKSATSKKGS